MPSTRTSAGSRAAETAGCRAFQVSRAASASALVAARAISMTGMDVLRRPVGVGREPVHSVGRPAFGSPAATALARSARDARAAGRRPRHDRCRTPRRPSACATAGRVAVRPPAWRSWAATAHRPGPRSRAAVTAPEAHRGSRRRHRCRRPGSPIAAYRAGTVSSVNASASTVGTSSHVSGGDARVGQRPDRVRRGHRPILGVLVVVEEDAVALLLPPLRGRRAGQPPLDVPSEGEPLPGGPPGRSTAVRCAR